MGNSTGARIDNFDIEAAGATPTATMLRLFYAPGNAGVAISAATAVTTTATFTTSGNHGLSVGMTVYMTGFYPLDYNGIFTVVNATVANAFTVTLPTTPTTSAVTIGTFSYSVASPTLTLFREVPITSIASPSSTTACFSSNLNTNVNPDVFPIVLPPGYSIRASIQDTQTVAAANPISVCTSQTIAANAYAAINGSLATSAATAAAGALQTLGGAGYMSLTATPYALPNPAQVTLTSAGNISAVNFTIIGTDPTGATITETIAGPNNATVYFTKIYASILQVYANGAVGTNTSIGYSAIATFVQMSKVAISSSANLTGVNFTITGMLGNGTVQSEVLTGPAIGTVVTSVNSYKVVTSIVASALANPTLIGNPAIITGIKVTARGGAF
jgi:hypothetical protein